MATENKNKKMRNVRNHAFVMVALSVLILCQAAFATDCMVAYWRFDEGDGSTAFDSVNENHGILYGPTWETGQVGTALSFDGIDDIVEIPESPYWDFGSSDFTIDFWLKYPDVPRDYWESVVGNQCTDSVSGWGIWIDNRGNGIGFEVGGSPDRPGEWVWQYIFTLDGLTIGSWNHVVISREGTGIDNFKIYVDDILVKTDTLDAFADNDYPLRIGRSYEVYYPPFPNFSGLIDEVAIYNRALTYPEMMLGGTALFIMDEVDTGNIDPELEGSLLAKVDAALSALGRGNPNDAKVAMNDLKALINQVEAQTDKKITAETAAEIIQSANDIIAELGV